MEGTAPEAEGLPLAAPGELVPAPGTVPTRVWGLTLWRPWSCAIAWGSKRIENRPWAPYRQVLGQLLAIHAGGKWDEEGAEYVARLHPDLPGTQAWTQRGIVAVARLVAVRRARSFDQGVERTDADALWEFGPWAWKLGNVLAIERAIPALGKQKLWPLEASIAADLLARWRARFDPRTVLARQQGGA